jgi:hypothetical protein
MLPVVLYGFETQSLILREGHRFKVCENGVLGKIFGPKSDGVTWEWRKLRNKELCDLYCSPNFVGVIKLRIMRWAGHVARLVDRRNAHEVSVGKLMGREHYEYLGVDGKLIMKLTVEK